MNNLINFDDFIEITRDKAEKLKLVEFLQQLGLVSRNFNCPKCRKEMKLSFRNDTADGCYWLCTEKTSVAKKKPQKCRSSVSIRNNYICPIKTKDWANSAADFFWWWIKFQCRKSNATLEFPNQPSADGQNSSGILYSTL